jgi:hypothetical protein
VVLIFLQPNPAQAEARSLCHQKPLRVASLYDARDPQ